MIACSTMSDEEEEETRGRHKKDLDSDLLKKIVDSTDEVLTTQEIRLKYNKEKDDSSAHQTVERNLASMDDLRSIKLKERTGWLLREGV